MSHIWRRLALPAACVALLVLPAPGRAEPVRGEINKLAQKIVKLLEEQNQTAVAVGAFVGPAQFETNAGPGFQGLLCEELEKVKPGVVQKAADLSVRGRYARIDLEGEGVAGQIAVKVTAEVFDKKDESILKVSLEITDTKDIARILGVTASLPPEGSKTDRHKELDRRLKNPEVFIHGDKKTLVSSGKDSPYSVELLVKPKDGKDPARPREANAVGGQAFVDVKIGELYEVRVRNNSDQEVGVSLAVDGIDVFTFSEDRNDKGEPRFTHFILAPKSETTVVGWHRTIDPKRKDNYLSFLVTDYGQGAASKFPAKSQGKVGTITASFATSFPFGRSGSETGFGPPREVKQTAVKRSFDPPHDFVTIRYNR
jgi:hypothetical protein